MKEISSLKLLGITLLSFEDAKRVPQDIRMPTEDGWWWLQSPGYYRHYAMYIREDGACHCYGTDVARTGLVRPALRASNLSSAGFKQLDKVEIFGHVWTVITDDLLLCDNSIGQMAFHNDSDAPDANDYKKSDIKAYLDDWFANQLDLAERRVLRARVEAMWKD